MGVQGQWFPGCKWGRGAPRVPGQVLQGMGRGRELACLAAWVLFRLIRGIPGAGFSLSPLQPAAPLPQPVSSLSGGVGALELLAAGVRSFPGFCLVSYPQPTAPPCPLRGRPSRPLALRRLCCWASSVPWGRAGVRPLLWGVTAQGAPGREEGSPPGHRQPPLPTGGQLMDPAPLFGGKRGESPAGRVSLAWGQPLPSPLPQAPMGGETFVV